MRRAFWIASVGGVGVTFISLTARKGPWGGKFSAPVVIPKPLYVADAGGRLLIVDFAPHDLEFLREKFAHERLGFANSQVDQWLRESGLTLVQNRELAPPSGSGPGKLTVSLWLAARDQEANSAVKSPTRPLEPMRSLP